MRHGDVRVRGPATNGTTRSSRVSRAEADRYFTDGGVRVRAVPVRRPPVGQWTVLKLRQGSACGALTSEKVVAT